MQMGVDALTSMAVIRDPSWGNFLTLRSRYLLYMNAALPYPRGFCVGGNGLSSSTTLQCAKCVQNRFFFLYPITENYTASAPELSIYNKN